MRYENSPALVLNADYRPLCYFPLSLWSWQDTVKAVFLNRVNIVAQYDREVRSPSVRIRLPSVISLKRYVQVERRPAFTRFNVFLRDGFTCQYCGRQARQLTLDHVTPRVRRGPHTWENVVAACVPCNHRKAGRTPKEAGMKLLREPAAPKANPYYHLMHRKLPDEWNVYLPWAAQRRAMASA